MRYASAITRTVTGTTASHMATTPSADSDSPNALSTNFPSSGTLPSTTLPQALPALLEPLMGQRLQPLDQW